jgi:hypothetical protein
MARRVAYLAAATGLAVVLTGCALNLFGEQREAWREAEERACMREREVVLSAFVQRARKINGRGACGIEMPLEVAALAGGSVAIRSSATLGCPMTAALDAWMQESVQPTAIAWFGMPVVEIKQVSDYSCRSRNNIHGERLSEHAFGNAIDVASFTLANGRPITVKGGWRGAADEQGFLREAFATACQRFKTVLGPGVRYHGDHFHLDLAHHGRSGTSHYCRPTPSAPPPVRDPYREQRIAAFPAPDAGAERYPPLDQSLEPLPEETYWPRTLPRANIPLGYAPE